jgi:oxalate decarboxylase
MTTSTTRSTHTTSLLSGDVVEENDFGSMRRITVDNLPILKNLSIKRVLLNPGAIPACQGELSPLVQSKSA